MTREKKSVGSLAHLCAGDQESWSAFVEENESLIYYVVRNTIAAQLGRPNPADVKDVVQNVFLRLIKEDYRLLKTYDPRRAALPTWLRLVARSSAIDFLRSLKSPFIFLPETTEVGPPGDAEISYLENSLGVLSEREALILRLLFEGGLSPNEVAEELGIRTQTVYSHKSKAINKLRKYCPVKPSR